MDGILALAKLLQLNEALSSGKLKNNDNLDLTTTEFFGSNGILELCLWNRDLDTAKTFELQSGLLARFFKCCSISIDSIRFGFDKARLFYNCDDDILCISPDSTMTFTYEDDTRVEFQGNVRVLFEKNTHSIKCLHFLTCKWSSFVNMDNQENNVKSHVSLTPWGFPEQMMRFLEMSQIFTCLSDIAHIQKVLADDVENVVGSQLESISPSVIMKAFIKHINGSIN